MQIRWDLKMWFCGWGMQPFNREIESLRNFSLFFLIAGARNINELF